MNNSFWAPVFLSLQTATIALIIVVILGIVFARWMTAKQFKGKTIIETLLLLPLVLPPTVVGFLLIILFGRNSIIGSIIETILGYPIMFTWSAAVIAASVVAFPMMYQSAKTGFLSVDKGAEEAARVDGASEWRVFLYITLPLSLKALIAGVILSFARALGEFGATLMFAGNLPGKTQTIPTAIYVAFESGNMEAAWAWVIVIVIISFLMLLATRFLQS
ncbi:molybdate ABC transporter permease subunit [Mesobacillus maritimus]|uniref:molybdate ABC transporter permease subunit n=1 Tax=Mesobacillus maritimus TaxID=1643336 RepID=UPI00203BECC7|nr:molybdate ABC transporter permease subunit [Mesobacillus maritimus]MCM3588089.1 molybdate ABC transporter permease subunit [Mesobacillus maritimus]MCM3668420.1 molybdate ABC transporter permease subunit [Mesobacillus maritimus]